MSTLKLIFTSVLKRERGGHNSPHKDCSKITQISQHILFGFDSTFCLIISFPCKVICLLLNVNCRNILFKLLHTTINSFSLSLDLQKHLYIWHQVYQTMKQECSELYQQKHMLNECFNQ